MSHYEYRAAMYKVSDAVAEGGNDALSAFTRVPDEIDNDLWL
jgi:hypothetical protein